jgi:transcriptional regulator with XRE-family HTH domain
MLGDYLKSYRLKNNYTQTKMAKLLKTSNTYYSLLERNLRKPGFKLISHISKVTNLSSEDIRNMLWLQTN